MKTQKAGATARTDTQTKTHTKPMMDCRIVAGVAFVWPEEQETILLYSEGMTL